MFDILSQINTWLNFIILIPIIIGIKNYTKLDFPLTLLLYFLIFDSVIIIITGVLGYKGINNLFYMNLSNVVELYLITYLFYLILTNSFLRIFIKISFLLFTIIVIITFTYFQNFNEYANNIKLIESGFFIIFASTYIYNQVKRETNLVSDPFVWFSVGILMYFVSTFLLYSSFQYLMKLDKTLAYKIWMIHNMFLYFLFIIIAITFHKQAKMVDNFEKE
jgi:hypothetical protein